MAAAVLGIIILCFVLFWLLNKFDYLRRVGDTVSYMLLQLLIIIILCIIFQQ